MAAEGSRSAGVILEEYDVIEIRWGWSDRFRTVYSGLSLG